jgi:uncharacterized membrane protein YoaK (UPF0700 family)
MPGERRQRSVEPIVALLLLLSATTGLIDAVSVLGLGKVFTANMTGNIVFLGFALAGAPGFRWQVYVTALLAFALGALVAGRLGRSLSRRRRRWLLTVAGLESGLLFLAAAVAALGPAVAPPISAPVLGMVALTAAAMGIRNATIRSLKVADLTTTVLTLTLTGLAADPWSRSQGPRRLLAVVSILLGATLGALLLLRFGLAGPLAAAAVIVLLATVLLAEEDAEAASPAG